MSTPSQFMRVERDGALARLIFARDKGINILSSVVLNELDACWGEIEGSGARVCVLRGEGKAFLAGADIKEMSALDTDGARAFAALGQRVFNRIENSEVVSVAALHGPCLGGGCELALACDLRIGAEGLLIGQPEVNLGLVPGFGGSQRLPRVVGQGWAQRMILGGEALDAPTALRIGLITDLVPAAELADRAEALARLLLTRGPGALRSAKRLVQSALGHRLSTGLQAEQYAFGQLFHSGEAREGTQAFIEKRAPKF